MTRTEFNKLVEKSLERISNTLIKKGQEYNFEEQDRLDCFKKAAALQNCSTTKATFGMLAKHIVSISDFVASGNIYSEEKIDEKVFDTICYLLLLKAAMIDDGLATNTIGLKKPEFKINN